MKDFLEFLKQLGPARLAAMGVVAALLVGFFAFIMMRVAEPRMTPLYTDLSFDDATQITNELESAAVPFEFRAGGTTIVVPDDQVLRLRMTLAEQGLPTGGGIGYEIFDKSNALGTTSFVQNMNHLRAMEGELARTIRSLRRIRSARVHLVIPERQLFERNKKEPTASIVLDIRGTLDTSQIRAIQHLVSSAVEGLKPTRVSIVDGSGRLLAAGTGDEDNGLIASSLEERQTKIEGKLQSQIEQIISSVVGPDRARVKVTAQLDYNRLTESQEIYDPDGQVVRSQQSKTENASSTEGADNDQVTAGNQLPNAGADANGGGSQEASNTEEETVNYEISRTTKTEIKEAGQIERISVAVLVDGVYTQNADGALEYAPRPQEQLDQIASLVRTAIGFQQTRGDTVEVVNLQFAEGPSTNLAGLEEPGLFDFTRSDLLYLIELGVILLMTLIVVFVVVRPLLKRAIGAEETEEGAEGAPEGELIVQEDGTVVRQIVQEDGTVTSVPATAQDVEKLENPMGSAIELAIAQGEVQAGSIRQIGDLVADNPDEAVKLIRNWLLEAEPA
ncbi:flagellar basal-body MS-ring/collar protein FliF [Coralliovum pocilloporae]|uniref:flagellar basal-body MS-ring/collar protein FliF n=1 Tax=Coralliovum pocilloporae TaxID=3066369 RepID=UPI003307672F